MFAVQMKTLLNAESKPVQNAGTFLQGDHLNFLNDGCLLFSNGVRVALVDVVLEETPKEAKWSGSQIGGIRCPFVVLQ